MPTSGGAIDVVQLAAVCPNGCEIRTAWVGAGHLGLCAVDEQNILGGARQFRALYRFRQRIYHAFGVPDLPTPQSPGSLPLVLVVQTKRVVTNLNLLVAKVNQLGAARAQLIQWEKFSFVEQLQLMRTAAVLVTGVGSAMQNGFLMPEGSVAICLGWRNEFSPHGIHYFDSHILRSLDHVRALYYPSYTRAELGRPGMPSVTLNLTKAVDLIQQALSIHAKGFVTPVPEDANANRYDRAFTQLVRETNGEALRARTDDYDWDTVKYPAGCTTMNGVEKMVWGESGRGAANGRCPWAGPVAKLIKQFEL